ncbi:ATP-dependent DNA ligase [Priestia megaterium]|uniref:ATP-dependent DNA ligase n=1 Tax=Priestia megaterium TaxID=1404 RepID=UPI000BECA4DF|nr:hypothetical protein [Priestia megaterium]PED63992.1 hypothetical protein CON20_23805 [Priestia megaterium]
MRQYCAIFNHIKNNSGRLAKEELLRQYENVEGFKEILQFVYDPAIVTGLAKRKMEKVLTGEPSRKITSIFEAMEFVKTNNTGTDEIVRILHGFLNTLATDEERELATSILIKDLPIGLSRTTLNKVYGEDFIYKYSVMLAGKYEAVADTIDEEFAISLKLDGLRATIFHGDNGIEILSRANKPYHGLIDIEKAIEALPKGMVYDGELIAHNPDGINSADLFRKTSKIARTKGIKTGLDFVMFDMLPIEEFRKGKSKLKYKDRLEAMERLFACSATPEMPLKLVPIYYIGKDKNMVPEILTKVEQDGFEGLMVNTLSGYYETKRTKSLLKVKTFYTADLRVIGVKEDIRGGKCGSLTVEYKGFHVDVAGLKEKDKVEFWSNPESIIGKLIEVKYFEESTNAQGTLSLRFPSFVRIRTDKTEVSYA